MRRLRKLAYLPKRDHRLLASAILLLGTVRLGLWLLPFQTLRRLLAGMINKTAKLQKTDPVFVNKVVWAVRVASRYMPSSISESGDACAIESRTFFTLYTLRSHLL